MPVIGNVYRGGFRMAKLMSNAMRKRIPLTTKYARKQGFYKGNNCRKEGRITSKARFIVNPDLRLNLIVPSPQQLAEFPLKAYVDRWLPTPTKAARIARRAERRGASLEAVNKSPIA